MSGGTFILGYRAAVTDALVMIERLSADAEDMVDATIGDARPKAEVRALHRVRERLLDQLDKAEAEARK